MLVSRLVCPALTSQIGTSWLFQRWRWAVVIQRAPDEVYAALLLPLPKACDWCCLVYGLVSLAKHFSQQKCKVIKNWVKSEAGSVKSNVLKNRQSQPICVYKLHAYKEMSSAWEKARCWQIQALVYEKGKNPYIIYDYPINTSISKFMNSRKYEKSNQRLK